MQISSACVAASGLSERGCAAAERTETPSEEWQPARETQPPFLQKIVLSTFQMTRDCRLQALPGFQPHAGREQSGEGGRACVC